MTACISPHQPIFDCTTETRVHDVPYTTGLCSPYCFDGAWVCISVQWGRVPVQLLAPCATTAEGTLLGAQEFGWVGGRTVASAAGAVAVLLATSRLGWGLTGIWAGLVSLVALNCAGDSYRLLSAQSPLQLRPQRRHQTESIDVAPSKLGVQDKQEAEEREEQALVGRR